MEEDRIVLTDESGQETEFELLDLVEYQGEEYAVLYPAEAGEEARRTAGKAEVSGKTGRLRAPSAAARGSRPPIRHPRPRAAAPWWTGAPC